MRKKRNPKKKLNTIDIVLIICGSLLVLFTIAMIIMFCLFQTVPDTLIVSFFGAFGIETVNCVIVHKDKKTKNQNDIETD